MATYKQRTPYIRRPSTDRHSSENDPRTLQTSGTARQHSSTATPPEHSYHNDDSILDKTSDQEWTSIRHAASARARARQQQQYFDQQQQRTREWQFVLGQHHHRTSFKAGSTTTATDAGRPISSDEYDEVLTASSAEPHLASPRAVDTGASGESSFEQSSVLGYSDLTSEGLDSVGDSEELDVWSQDDDDSISLFTPSFRRLSGPASPTGLSPSTSLFYLPRPSFAGPLSQSNSPIQPRFQNQMPLHDGSGNFAGQSPLTYESPGHESDHGSESIALGASSALRQFDSQQDTTRPRVISSAFASLIQNIASLQVQAGAAPRITSRPAHPSPPQSRFSDNDRRDLSLRLSSTPTFVTPGPTQAYPSNRALEMYDADQHELAEMISGIPSKLGWLQAFEHTFRMFSGMKDSGFDVMVGDSSPNNAVKAWTFHISQNNRSLSTLPEAQEEADSDSDARLEEIRKNMASASMDTLRRLQTRKRSHSPARNGRIFPVRSIHPLDPMQIDFVPTVLDQSEVESSRYPKNRRTTSRSTGTSTSHQDSRAQDSTLLSVFITTLRRLRDHVSSNFLYHDYLDEDDNGVPSRRLDFEGDLGIEWATGGGTGGTSASNLNSHDHHQHYYARRDRDTSHRYNPDRSSNTTPMSSSSSSTSSSFRRTSNIRRVSSDCGLESMKRYSRSQEPMPTPLYVD
ncbi:hypothetical protein BG005_004905 [Podila minutissima]|nr:hypothetical protein BG005_004905 [Podila minutissima]